MREQSWSATGFTPLPAATCLSLTSHIHILQQGSRALLLAVVGVTLQRALVVVAMVVVMVQARLQQLRPLPPPPGWVGLALLQLPPRVGPPLPAATVVLAVLVVEAATVVVEEAVAGRIMVVVAVAVGMLLLTVPSTVAPSTVRVAIPPSHKGATLPMSV